MKKAIIISVLLAITLGLTAQSHTYGSFVLMAVNTNTTSIETTETSYEDLTITNRGNGIYSFHITGPGMTASNKNTSRLKFLKTSTSNGVLFYDYYDTINGQYFLEFRTTRKLSEMAKYGGQATMSLTYATEKMGFIFMVN